MASIGNFFNNVMLGGNDDIFVHTIHIYSTLLQTSLSSPCVHRRRCLFSRRGGDTHAERKVVLNCRFLVSNHVMEGDWWMMLMLARCIGLPWTLRVFLPNEFSAATAGWSPASSAQDLTKHIMGTA
mmetsp:Transcript_2874/g.4340  ORF Transcript_2874/g.4340 Transcript_2874/m.4340 type:complete len:126 (-) Transcript_2874:437-814(-)